MKKKILIFSSLALALLVILTVVIYLIGTKELTVHKIIKSDNEVYEILKDLVGLKTGESYTILESNLLGALDSWVTSDLKRNLNDADNSLKQWEELTRKGMLPEIAFINAGIKHCIASSIINNDFNVCGIENDSEAEKNVSIFWNGDEKSVNYWVSAEHVMPYFLAGFLNYKNKNYEKSDLYFQKVKEYQGYLRYQKSSLTPSVLLFAKMYNKTIKISPVGKNEKAF